VETSSKSNIEGTLEERTDKRGLEGSHLTTMSTVIPQSGMSLGGRVDGGGGKAGSFRLLMKKDGCV